MKPYVRESILHPSAKVAAGYQPIMPTFQGVVSEEQLLELIEYVKSLKAHGVPTAPNRQSCVGRSHPVKK